MFSILKNLFNGKNADQISVYLDNLDRFAQGIKTLEGDLKTYNKSFAAMGLSKRYHIALPNPSLGGDTSYCFTDGYRLEMHNQIVTLYPERYSNGKFAAEISHLDREDNRIPIITQTEHKDLTLRQLQEHIKTAVKQELPSQENFDHYTRDM